MNESPASIEECKIRGEDNLDEDKSKSFASTLRLEEAEEMLRACSYKNTVKYKPDIRYAKVVKVYDGDTIDVATPLSALFICRFNVRLQGIDTPEMTSKNAFEKKAAVIVRDMLRSRIMNKMVEIVSIEKDKYGRLLCRVNDAYSGESINDWLLQTGWALPYSGRGEKEVRTINWDQRIIEYEGKYEGKGEDFTYESTKITVMDERDEPKVDTIENTIVTMHSVREDKGSDLLEL